MLLLVLVLVALFVAVSWPLPAALAKSSWPTRAPRSALALWLALVISSAGSLFGALLLAAIPLPVLSHGFGAVAHGCAERFGTAFLAPAAQSAASTLALGLLGLLVVRLGLVFAAHTARQAAARRRHAELLDVVAERRSEDGLYVIEHAAPLAYTLPGRWRRLVMSSGALKALNSVQRAAVLEHEYEHIRRRHHLSIALADIAGRAFPRWPVAALAGSQIRLLAELAADDRAVDRFGSRTVHSALVSLAALAPPAGALGATEQLGVRAARLCGPPVCERRVSVVNNAFSLSLVTVPLLLTVVPAGMRLLLCA